LTTEDNTPTRRGATQTADGRDLREIWDKYRADGHAEDRNALTEFYFDMIRANSENIAEILMEAIEENDLYQAGALGFFEAMEGFDPAKHSSFEEYGSLAIRRAIVAEIRALVGTEEENLQ
jgi:DNA-directed RNA polymerase specialized sigma subunit